MSSPVFRRLRKQTSSMEDSHMFRVAVFGQSGVGKTAFTVRFVTKRYIGEYDQTQDRIYQRACVVSPCMPVFYEIMDSAGQEENDDILTEKILWADAFILLYSVTDRVSFDEIARLKFRISHTSNKKPNFDPVIFIVGNKSDMDRKRMVSRSEGDILASSLKCSFHEVSVRDSFEEVSAVYEKLFREHWLGLRLQPPPGGSHHHQKTKGSRGISGGVEMPIIPHHFSPLPVRRKKSYKHVDKIPRLLGSPVVSPTSTPERRFGAGERFNYKEVTYSNALDRTTRPALERQLADAQISSLRQPVAEESFSSSGAEEELDSSGTDTPTAVDPKKAAEEFMRKTIVLKH